MRARNAIDLHAFAVETKLLELALAAGQKFFRDVCVKPRGDDGDLHVRRQVVRNGLRNGGAHGSDDNARAMACAAIPWRFEGSHRGTDTEANSAEWGRFRVQNQKPETRI
jgi:hypothetical protein